MRHAVDVDDPRDARPLEGRTTDGKEGRNDREKEREKRNFDSLKRQLLLHRHPCPPRQRSLRGSVLAGGRLEFFRRFLRIFHTS